VYLGATSRLVFAARAEGRGHNAAIIKRDADLNTNEGLEPPKNSYPFVVILQQGPSTYASKCHGILIDEYTILTSANKGCLALKEKETRALGGMHNIQVNENTKQTREVCQIDKSPANSGDKNSFMLFHLNEPFRLNQYVKAAKLPLTTEVTKVEKCWFVTWATGWKIPKHLKVTAKNCFGIGLMDKSIICTGTGPCNDDGAPLVCTQKNREFVAGVYIRNSAGCDAATTDFTFASFIGVDRDWIDSSKQTAVKNCQPL
jgi:hypothetical protein